MKIIPLPAGFVVPAQPVKAPKPPVGTDWVHEIKHDGYRIIVRRDGFTVRLYSRNAYDWTVRLAGIAAAAELIKAKSFTIDGEAVVLGPDGLSRFEELRRREAARTAILYAFDLIEHDGEDLSQSPVPGPEGCAGGAAGRSQSRHPDQRTHRRGWADRVRPPASLAPRASYRRRLMVPTCPARAASGSRSAIPPASPCNGSGARFGIDESQASARRR
jgi:ATP dependent DNA ligase domain